MGGAMYGMQRNGLRPEEQPAKRLKPSQVQAVMKGNHGTSLVEAMAAEEIQSHLENLRVGGYLLHCACMSEALHHFVSSLCSQENA